jgi:YegS/Rv2252/BmrU family lipid kinase
MNNPVRKLLFVINPIAGGVDKADAKSRIERYCPSRNWTYRFLETTGEADEQRIRSAIEAFTPDTVVAGGGDGTINLVARTLLGHSGCRLGILPLGSANGLAGELGIGPNVEAALEVLSTGRVVAMDALLVQETHYSFHLADIGYNAQLIHNFEQADRRGRLGYLREAVRTLWERPYGRFHLTVDDQEWRTPAVMITFANGRRYGSGAFVNPDGAIDDGWFEVCIFRPWPRWYLIWLLIRSFLGRVESSRWVRILPAQRVRLQVDRPLPLQVDGEALGTTDQVSVAIAKEKVGIWLPN